jgi:cbb3-type cytochrome oxidase subunit 3
MYFTFILLILTIVFAIVWFGTRAKRSADEPDEGVYPEPDDNLEPRP